MSIFSERVQEHQTWLRTNGATGRAYHSGDDDDGNACIFDLTDSALTDDSTPAKVDLSRADMGYTQYTGIDFAETKFNGATFEGATLDCCDLSCCDLVGATFNDAVIDTLIYGQYTVFVGCKFIDATFIGIVGATFIDCNLSGAKFAKCDLSGATFDDCCMVGVDMWGAETRNMLIMDNCRLSATTLFGVDLATLATSELAYCEHSR